ncbi:serpentine type 7TM GPCR chemoreceptor srd domain-containing protein [Ditylenchus destructor]|uniref:Serpentine type 7TM GPCR chemoreceptor srd domain-containing protein n=1 Tax=Ditylenchus destructor TaxID=166010 RepID=A0AAD4QZ02_9BILA|nr:serpentine type 7TM GPCR chemoreceptor srd domain-containing protein [Ditylenchus destructor]
MTGGGNTIIISNGFFAGRSSSFDSALVLLWAFLLHTNVLWIPVQFIYRYRLLCKSSEYSTKSNIAIASAIIVYSVLGIFIMISWCQVREEFQPLGQHVLDFNEWPNHGEKIFFTGASIRDWRMVAWLLLWTTTCSGSIAIVIWCEKRIMANFNQFGNPTSAATQRMHKEFHRALLAMAICPLVTTTVPLSYYLFAIFFQLRTGKISAIMTTATTCITLFNPLTTIIFLRCYRQVALKMITCAPCRRKVVPQETITLSSTLSGHTAIAPQRQLLQNQNF